MEKIIYYTDELNDEFAGDNLKPRVIDENYIYMPKGIWKKFTRFFWYRIIATPLAALYLKLTLHHKVIGRKNFKRYKNSIGSEKNPYIDSINYNPHSNKYEEQYNKMNKITKQKMINIKNGVNKNINGELTYDEIFEKIKNNLNT